LLHVRRARIRFTPKGIRVSPASFRVGGKSGINISRSGVSTSTRTRFGTYNSKRGCSIPIMLALAVAVGVMYTAARLLA
jgi:hypothetical protein